jgi:CubicO group peptidase (beta-lactamase class C family)
MSRFLLVALALSLLAATALPASAQSSNPASPIDTLVQQAHERGVLNGTVLVARDGTIVYHRAVGYADGQKTPLTRAHRFSIGSIGKEFSAVGLMVLHERGALRLDGPVSEWLPSLPHWADSVHVRDLLTYTSGLPRIRYDHVTDDAEAFADLQALPALEFTPRTGYRYSNNNILLRRRVIEAAARQPYHTFVREHLLEPCGMTGAITDPAPGTPNVARAFDGRFVEDGGLGPTSGHTLVTARDLYRWTQCLHAGTLITDASLFQLFDRFEGGQSALGSQHEITKTPTGEDVIVWHAHLGEHDNYQAVLYVNRADAITVLILTNNKQNQVASLAMAIDAILKGNPYAVPRKSLEIALRTVMVHDGFATGRAFYDDIKTNHPDQYEWGNEEDVLTETGEYLLWKQRLHDALQVYRWAAERFPESTEAHIGLGETRLAQGDHAEAAQHFRHALTLDPSSDRAQRRLADLEATPPVETTH